MNTNHFTAEDLMGAVVNMGGAPYIIEDEEQAAQVAESISNATSMRELYGEELVTAREQLDCPGAKQVYSFVDGSEFLVCLSENRDYVLQKMTWAENNASERATYLDENNTTGQDVVYSNDTYEVRVFKTFSQESGHYFTGEDEDFVIIDSLDGSQESYLLYNCTLPEAIAYINSGSNIITTRKDLGRVIRQMRLAKGISIRGLADICGLSPSTVQNIENGAFSPRLDIVLRILSELEGKLIITPS